VALTASASATGFKVGCNKKVIGMFKDEAAGKQITEFVGLRPKCHALTTNGIDTKKCKGTKKVVIKKRLTVDDYRRCAYNHKPKLLAMNTIHSHKHELFSETINKIALSTADEKRVIQDDLISTLAIRHYRLAGSP
jgi:hypothetical protein